MWGGFYRDPAVRERIRALARAQAALPDAPSVSEVLLVANLKFTIDRERGT